MMIDIYSMIKLRLNNKEINDKLNQAYSELNNRFHD